jgi:hypothetical protein
MTTNVVELFILLSFFSLYVYAYRIKVLQKRVAALSRMEAKIDLLLRQSGITFEPYENVPSNIVEQVKKGNRYAAVALYRKSTGASRKDADAYVEKVGERAGALPGIGYW